MRNFGRSPNETFGRDQTYFGRLGFNLASFDSMTNFGLRFTLASGHQAAKLDRQRKLQSIHKKMGPGSGELPYLAIFRDFIVHSAVLRTLKFEKGCLNWGSNRRMHCCRQGQTAWILMVFPNSLLLGQNLAEILFLLWLAFWTKKILKKLNVWPIYGQKLEVHFFLNGL